MGHLSLSGNGLVVGYPGRRVLDGADIVIPAGGRVALLGANGSGKTTLLRALSGALPVESGDVRVDGVPLRRSRSGLRAHRRTVQLVLQDPDDQLFAADVARDVSFGPMNLDLPPDEVAARVGEALELLALSDLADRPIHELSFGQRKRVAIAGAVAMRPCLVLLDEPTAGLDPAGVQEMLGALARLEAADTTVVIATHDVDLALSWAHIGAVVVDGAVYQGEIADVLGNRELIARARLRTPTVLDIAAELGVSTRGITDAASLVVRLREAASRGAERAES
ncbi:ATP-binding cassette domain-containing protein [Epidermidibacterium keratini]|uniref:ABC transporter ATP-binding protein n=1 Tax=Epidermidibacterium keratini TaxID=1891644 RepID=A0A7L4YL54_9ACTN|nr:ATP-binding cassette domain-containing protein [Epidermidibacterium keratini]QHB99859.1 ATP-binding cassette domain-containing protein [Epidermidibacterium keratini]